MPRFGRRSMFEARADTYEQQASVLLRLPGDLSPFFPAFATIGFQAEELLVTQEALDRLSIALSGHAQ